MLRPRTNVVTVIANGLTADSLFYRLLNFSGKERLKRVIYLPRILTDESLDLCWQSVFKKKSVLNVAKRVQEKKRCAYRIQNA